jgi:hypothetical protein
MLNVDHRQIPVVQEVPQDIVQEAVEEVRHGFVPTVPIQNHVPYQMQHVQHVTIP